MIYLSYVTLHIKIRLYKLLYCKLIKLSVLFTLLIRLSHRPQGIWKKHSFLIEYNLSKLRMNKITLAKVFHVTEVKHSF